VFTYNEDTICETQDRVQNQFTYWKVSVAATCVRTGGTDGLRAQRYRGVEFVQDKVLEEAGSGGVVTYVFAKNYNKQVPARCHSFSSPRASQVLTLSASRSTRAGDSAATAKGPRGTGGGCRGRQAGRAGR
jgi:hypothetical protein